MFLAEQLTPFWEEDGKAVHLGAREGYKGLGSLSRVAVLDLFPCQIKRSKKNRRGGELHTDKNRQWLGACDKEERANNRTFEFWNICEIIWTFWIIRFFRLTLKMSSSLFRARALISFSTKSQISRNLLSGKYELTYQRYIFYIFEVKPPDSYFTKNFFK